MWNGLLPIGSVVLLKDSTKRVMIIGYIQAAASDDNMKTYDYSGCLYPEGYLDPNQVYLFDHEQIETIYSVGYIDEEQMAFIGQAESILSNIRAKEAEASTGGETDE